MRPRVDFGISITGFNDLRVDNSYPDVLVIIDLQPGFRADTYEGPMLANIEDEIILAVAHGTTIIFVEYDGNSDHGDTLPKLLRLTNGYKNAFRITKNADSGASSILKLFEKLGINFAQEIRVCGISTSDCVRSTVLDLCMSDMVGCVAVVENACSQVPTYRPEYTRKCLLEMQKLGLKKLKIEFEEEELSFDLNFDINPKKKSKTCILF